jgi:Flp pilus assembly pilin Flp
VLYIFQRLLREEEGATMVEYGLLVALIAMVALVGIATLGGKSSDPLHRRSGVPIA